MAKVKVGDAAPDFALRSQDGEIVRLSDLLARGSVVVYFYPRDRTPGCTAEAGAFRDSYARFGELGAQVVGISSDSVESHRGFATECDLPFKILSDIDGKVRREYGVTASMGLIPGRVTYVIDTGGTVRCVFSSQLHATRHVKEALESLQRLGDGGRGTRDPSRIEGD
ncbi:MAG TPA: peroxiredoxin [Nitrososphaerales archaeon]|nr:peroxiredoxin [Nitrososphaerales archaeon]